MLVIYYQMIVQVAGSCPGFLNLYGTHPMQSYKTSLNMKYKPPITWCIMLRPLLMELSLCPSLCPPCWVFGASPSFCMIVFTNWSSVTLRRTFSCCIILLKWQIPKLKDHNRRMWINFPSPFFIYLPPVHSFFVTCSFVCFLLGPVPPSGRQPRLDHWAEIQFGRVQEGVGQE